MFEDFIHGQVIHFPAVLVASGFDGRLEKMAGNLNGQRVRNNAAGAFPVFNPGRMRQGYPHWTPIDYEFDVDGVRMACGHSNNQGLIQAVQFMAGPAVGGVKVVVHRP